MPGFFQEHLRPLAGSAGLHVALLAALGLAALRWTSSQPPVELAIEGYVADAPARTKTIPAPRSEPAAEAPPPAEVTPPPEPVAEPPQERRAEEAAAAERAATAERERRQVEERAAREREAQLARDQAAADQRKAEEAERKRAAEAEAKRKAAEDAERKKLEAAEARRKAEEKAQAEREAKVRAEREADLQRRLAADDVEFMRGRELEHARRHGEIARQAATSGSNHRCAARRQQCDTAQHTQALPTTKATSHSGPPSLEIHGVINPYRPVAASSSSLIFYSP